MRYATLLLAMVTACVGSGCGFVVIEDDGSDDNPNRAPTARIDIDRPDRKAGTTATLSAVRSTDPEDDPLDARFRVRDPEGDIVEEVGYRPIDRMDSVEFTPGLEGEYQVRLAVRDIHDRIHRTTETFEATNNAPTATASWSLHDDGRVDAQGSDARTIDAAGNDWDRLRMRIERIRDADGDRATVRWRLDRVPTGYAGGCTDGCSGSTFEVELEEPGVYEGRAIVVDDHGGTDELSFRVDKTSD